MTEPDFLAALESDARPGPDCSVSRMLVALEAKDASLADQVRAAIDGPFTATAISRELHRRGYRISDQTISRHRRRICRCAA